MGVDAGMPETVFESNPSVSQETTDEVNQVRRPYLTPCMSQTVLESQLPHQIGNLFFYLVMINNKLTIL